MQPNPAATIALGALGIAGFALFLRTINEAAKKNAAKEAEEQAQEAAFRAANGWSFAEVAREITGNFDQDGDGRLAYDAVRGSAMVGESQRSRVTDRWTENLRMFGVPTGTKVVREQVTTWTIEPTLRKADANGDGVATRAEIEQLLRTYDADRNGRLSAAERSAARADLGSVLVGRTTKTIGLVAPQTPRPNPRSTASQTAPSGR